MDQKSERIVALSQDDALSRKAGSVRESGALCFKRLNLKRERPSRPHPNWTGNG